jgi:hypothetical protein
MATVVGTMTDRPGTTARPPTPPVQPKGSTTGEPQRSAQRSAQARHADPLLGAFPLVVITLATFLVLFTLMMARLKAGTDPALRASTSTPLASASSGTGAVTTRTSGGGESAAMGMPTTGSEESPATTPAAVTRTSGAPGTMEAGDE